jgi:hypothetical protein
VLAAAPMLTPSRYSVRYCDVAPDHVSVTSLTVAKKFCPLAVKVKVPGPGGGGGGGGGGGEGSGGGAAVRPEKSRRLGEPFPAPFTTPCVALEVIVEATCDGVAVGFVSRYAATTPATCGVAIDVPLIVFVAASPDPHAEVIETPGANTSTQLPKFAHEAFVSVSSVALTVSAAPTLAGELLQAFAASPKMLPFPAAIE